MAQELVAGDTVVLGGAHQAALMRDEALVDVVELLDQRLDAVGVERERLHVGDDDVLQLGLLLGLGGRDRAAAGLEIRLLVLELAQLAVVRGDVVEGLENARLDLGLHGRERHVVLHVVLVVAAFRRDGAVAILGLLALLGLAALRRAAGVGAA